MKSLIQKSKKQGNRTSSYLFGDLLNPWIHLYQTDNKCLQPGLFIPF